MCGEYRGCAASRDRRVRVDRPGSVWWIPVASICVLASCASLAPRGIQTGPRVVDGGVRFQYYAPGASRVQLGGDWPGNNWARGDGEIGEADVGLMKRRKDGVWEIMARLGPGRYRYAFWVDDNVWRVDPGNLEEVVVEPAGLASLLVIVRVEGRLDVR